MFFLCFQLGGEDFAFDSGHVHALAPVLPVRAVPGTPEYVRGIIEYRSQVVPLIDLSHLVTGKAARPVLGTRIIMIDYAIAPGEYRLLGLIAEKVLHTVTVTEDALHDPGINAPEARYMGKLFKKPEGGWVQVVEPLALLPDTLTQQLFAG